MGVLHVNVSFRLGAIRVALLRGHIYYQSDWGPSDLGLDCLCADLSCLFVASARGRGWEVANSPKRGSHKEATGSAMEKSGGRGLKTLIGRPVLQWQCLHQ